MPVLKIGDTVKWRGAYGSDAPKPAVVEQIEITNGAKSGKPVEKVCWSAVFDRNVVVVLATGKGEQSWAYAHQISQR